MIPALLLLLLGLVLLLLWLQFRPGQTPSQPLAGWRIVDLTHPLTATIPIWPSDPPLELQPWASYATAGYFIHRISIGEHSGTHWGTPNTFLPGAASADQISVEKLVTPAVVIDGRSQAANNPDYRLSLANIQTWEASHGTIPAGSLVILWTGWQERWQDAIAFLNQDAQGVPHWPGFSAAAVHFLITNRHISGLGTDTHGADPGNDPEYGASSAMYQANGIILECLGGLEQLPPTGAILIIGGLPIQGGAGSPARILALVPHKP